MALAAVASQLRAAQETAASSLPATAQAGDAVASISGAFQGARGALSSFVGDAQARARLLTEQAGVAQSAGSAIPSDGTRCEECGVSFGALNRRTKCGSCERWLCASCHGQNALVALTGIRCFGGSGCPRCREQGVQANEFEAVRATMESGASATLGLPTKSAGLFAVGEGRRTLPVWFCLDKASGKLHWATLEQRNGQPAEQGLIPVYEVVGVRDTGAAVELATKGQGQPLTLTFATPAEGQAWARYVELAVKILTPEGERAALDAARSVHRQRELEERRAANEERKKQLSEGLGMRFTAEAMVNRGRA